MWVLIAQWLECLTGDQKVVSLSPAGNSDIFLSKNIFPWRNVENIVEQTEWLINRPVNPASLKDFMKEPSDFGNCSLNTGLLNTCIKVNES